MTARAARLVSGTRQVALTVGAIVGVLCIVVTIAAIALEVRPLVFRSGSMGPTIDTGALAIARETAAADLRVGQVVSVRAANGSRVTHRIVSVDRSGGATTLELKGDANEAVDASPYVVDRADVVLFSVPEVGYVVGWLAGPAGIFTLGLYAAFLLSVLVRGTTSQPRRLADRGDHRRAGRPGRRARARAHAGPTGRRGAHRTA